LALKKDLLDLFLLGGQLHHRAEEPFLEAEELHSTTYVVMHGHEGQLLGGAKPAKQLIADVQKPCECLKVILLALIKVVECFESLSEQCAETTFVHWVRLTSWKHCSMSGNNIDPSHCLFAGNH
jgi:hypothetical protein